MHCKQIGDFFDIEQILFIVHRDEILYQARDSFKRIMPENKYGIYNGKIKEGRANAIFALIYTMSIKKQLERFREDEFGLIIVDEFHHASGDSYKRVR